MPNTFPQKVTQSIIRKLIHGENYRIEIVTLINAQFLQYTIDFFKKIVEAKLKNQNITIDWYKKEFLKAICRVLNFPPPFFILYFLNG